MTTYPAPSAAVSAPAAPFSVRPGEPFPLGATWDGRGTNFAVFSEVAEAVDLCLFDDAGRERRIRLPEHTAFCWHGYLPGIRPGQRYGFRVHGPWNPAQGQRCNPAKLLVDPYAKSISGDIEWTVNDEKGLEQQALDKAAARVKESAAVLAKGMGVRLGNLIYVSNQAGGGARPVYAMRAMAADKAAPQPLSIEPHKVSRSATVYAVYSIE